MWKFAASFLLISGIASLTYQVVWVRLLGLSMGSTSASISTVLAAFFLGLALGSYLAERITRNRINSFTPYLVLELIIGLSGLALLPLLLNLDQLMAISPEWGSQLPFKFAITMALLVLPTLCMGATFPVMAALVVRRQQNMGQRISQLYALNTAGAVLGAALSGFVFIPMVGLDGAVYIAFILNMSIVAMVLTNKKRLQPEPIEDESKAEAQQPTDGADKAIKIKTPYRFRALIILFCTGFVAIASEVGWTKYLSIFAGSTIYGFAAILTVFLIGIASGSWAVRRHMEWIQSPQAWMAFGLVLLGASLLLTRGSLSLVPYFYEATNHLQGGALLQNIAKYSVVFVMIFIPTFIFGALFPLNLKLYCGNLTGVRQRIGKAYAINTVASIAGSIAAGFWIIPQYGTDFLLTVLAMIILALPILFIPSVKAHSLKAGLTLLLVAGVGSHWFFSHINYERLISSVDYQFDDDAQNGKEPKYLYLGEGKAGVISVVTYDDNNVKLQNNGLNESFLSLKDEKQRLIAETLLGLMPYLMQKEAKSAFVVGFGGGVTSETLTWTRLESIRIVELEPKVVEAVSVIHGGKAPPALQDPRVKIDFNDARNTLLVEDTRYDIIASQPSHPWRAGAANVFTQDFFQIVHSRLNEGGVYGQWVNLFNMDVATLQSIVKSFYTVFPHGFAMANIESGDYILIGGKQELTFDFTHINAILSLPKVQTYLSYMGINRAQDLFFYFAHSRDEWLVMSKNATPNRDTNLLSEVRLSMMDKVKQGGPRDPYKFLIDNYTMDVNSLLDKEKAPQQVYDIAQFYLQNNHAMGATKLAHQLEKLDANLAMGLKYHIHIFKGEWQQANTLYASQEQWPSEVHAKQANILMDQGNVAQAKIILPKITDVQSRRILDVQILYAEKQWLKLEKWLAQSDQERKWQLLALARKTKTATKSIKELSKIVNGVDDPLPAIRLLLEYYSQKKNEAMVNKYARLLVKAVDQNMQRWNKQANLALNNKDLPFAKTLLKQMRDLNAQAKMVSKLQEKINTAQDSVVQIGE